MCVLTVGNLVFHVHFKSNDVEIYRDLIYLELKLNFTTTYCNYANIRLCVNISYLIFKLYELVICFGLVKCIQIFLAKEENRVHMCFVLNG